MITGAGPMVKFVMLVLLLMSIFSWAIIIFKVKQLRKMEQETNSFYEFFWKNKDFTQISSTAKNYPLTPLTKLFNEVYKELGTPGTDIGYIKRLLKKAASKERALMDKSIAFLATTGNTAPFIGLFGTVWGIMNTFRAIGVKGAANLAVVAPGISEALIATAMGLFAAIPAVVGYNHIVSRIERISVDMDSFETDLLNIAEKRLKQTDTKSRTTEV
jgi:biopolymer transport protein TolQ